MSMILYYSNFCNNCKVILQTLSKYENKNDVHFINIDKRVKRENGSVYIILENNQEILLPPTVNRVPALLLLNRGHNVIFGSDILKHLEPQQVISNNKATNNNGEPTAFSICQNNGGNAFGVVSDNYSFLDQEPTELSSKGNGGLRQRHHYMTINENDCIETPPENYVADKVGPITMEELEKKRNNEIIKNKNEVGMDVGGIYK